MNKTGSNNVYYSYEIFQSYPIPGFLRISLHLLITPLIADNNAFTHVFTPDDVVIDVLSV